MCRCHLFRTTMSPMTLRSKLLHKIFMCALTIIYFSLYDHQDHKVPNFLRCASTSSISHHKVVSNDDRVQATDHFSRSFGSHLFLTIKSKCQATLGDSHFFKFPLTSRKVVLITSVGWVFVFFWVIVGSGHLKIKISKNHLVRFFNFKNI